MKREQQIASFCSLRGALKKEEEDRAGIIYVTFIISRKRPPYVKMI